MASQDHIGILTQPCEPVYGAGNKNIEVVLINVPTLAECISTCRGCEV